jgi:23S rRNA (adenine2503-C2)-methyltransferase
MGQMNDSNHLRNIVMMGMGEPLANYANVISALNSLIDGSWGLGFSCRRVTLSTVGLAPRLDDLGKDSGVSLAVSLNAADDQTRDFLMPINRRYPLAVLMEACRRFPLKPTRRITFEYILIKDVNDGGEHARRLAKLLRPVKAKINLIPFNPHRGCDFARPDETTIQAFQKILVDSHYTAIIRKSKGQDIGAACGQLGGRPLNAPGFIE